MNLSQFRDAVAGKLGLDNNVSTEQPRIDGWINEGVIKVLEDTHCYVKEETFTPFDGTSTNYTMDSGILEIVDAYFVSSGVNYRLERVSVNELIERKRISVPTGTPTMYVAMNGENMLQFWPAPGVSDTLDVYFVPIPTALSVSSDDPSTTTLGGVPSYFHKAIEYWACAEGADYDDDQTSAQGQRYRDDYDKEIVRYRKHMRRRAGNRNQRAVVNDVKKRRPFHDPSIYPSSTG